MKIGDINRTSRLSGFTLIETIVAFALLTGVVVSFITLVTMSLNSYRTSRLSYTATKIAQEGMELVVSKRDNHVLSVKSNAVKLTLDASPNKNHGIIINGASYVGGGVYGDALKFNASSRQYIIVPDSPSLDVRDGMTITAWIKQLSSLNAAIFQRAWGDLNADYIGLWTWDYPPRNYSFAVEETSMSSVGENVLGGPSSSDIGTWVHIAGTYDKSNLKIYKDGALVNSKPLSGFLPQENNIITIGAETNNNGAQPLYFFNGFLDDIYFYNRPLSDTEIISVKNNTLPPTNGLVGHWKLDDEIPPGLDDWRDNFLDPSPPYSTGVWEVDAAKTDQLLPQNEFNDYEDDHYLCLKTVAPNQGKFGYCTGPETPIPGNFRRKVEIFPIDDQKVRVRITVDWETKLSNPSLVLEEVLYGLP